MSRCPNDGLQNRLGIVMAAEIAVNLFINREGLGEWRFRGRQEKGQCGVSPHWPANVLMNASLEAVLQGKLQNPLIQAIRLTEPSKPR